MDFLLDIFIVVVLIHGFLVDILIGFLVVFLMGFLIGLIIDVLLLFVDGFPSGLVAQFVVNVLVISYWNYLWTSWWNYVLIIFQCSTGFVIGVLYGLVF